MRSTEYIDDITAVIFFFYVIILKQDTGIYVYSEVRAIIMYLHISIMQRRVKLFVIGAILWCFGT